MDIRHRLYPYPVLTDDTDDYINSKFNMELQVTKGLNELCFLINLELENEEINQLIHDGFAEYVVHIECPYTSYRTVIKTDDVTVIKNISEHKLNGKVAVCSFIVAKKNISGYHNSLFNDDYGDMHFTLNKGNVIAIGGQTTITITKEIEELSKIPSIFTICKNAEDIDDSMKIDITGEKIAITLCAKSFANYKMLAGIPTMLPVLHSILIVPTLIYTFETLKKEGVNEFEDLRWYNSVVKTLQKNGFTLDEELLDITPSYELAQKSLDMPIDRALDSLISQDVTDEEEYL